MAGIAEPIELSEAPASMPLPVADQEELCRLKAKEFGVIADVHPDDHLFGYLRSIAPVDKAVGMYFEDGRLSADMFASLIAEYGARNVLEFASGYGRVTRHMKHSSPLTEVTACDIHPQANEFVRDRIGMKAVQSSATPEELDAGSDFDMVFALSLFSHLPAHTWTRWLKACVQTVKPGGHVAFTTHGRVSARLQSLNLSSSALLYKEMSDQPDIDLSQYGSSYVAPKYVFGQIQSIGNARIVDFLEAYWWAHQDLYVIQRL